MRDFIFSLLHGLGIPGYLRRQRVKNGELSILMFHRVSDEYDPLWPPLPVKTFRLLVKELCKNTCVVPLEGIGQIDRYPERPLVVLSFDDGYRDFRENAVPILAEYGLPAHHNICPNLIDEGLPPWTQVLGVFLRCCPRKQLQLPHGRVFSLGKAPTERDLLQLAHELCSINDDLRHEWINALLPQIPRSKMPKLMNWDQVRECANLGVHIGSHGMNHRNLSRVNDRGTLLFEIEDSRKRIHAEVGVEPAIFAFPNGLYGPRSLEVARESGYRVALLGGEVVTVFAAPGHQSGFEVYPRIGISRANWKEENLRQLGFHQRLRNLVS